MIFQKFFTVLQMGEHREGARQHGARRGAVRAGAPAALPPPLLPQDQGVLHQGHELYGQKHDGE